MLGGLALPVSFWAIVPAANKPSAGVCGPFINGPAPASRRAGVFPGACSLCLNKLVVALHGFLGWFFYRHPPCQGAVLSNMRQLLLCWLLVVFAAGAAQAQSAGFLRAKEARIVDGQGREIILRGMGLGGWM